ncbi:MAG: nuclear transport factor 2 family protein [Alphaproteobacteria bacterium]|nr:nuclear transport factor 2 family protein [Alphaproteobacteria bacterium]
MAAADKLGGYAKGFGALDADMIAANVTADFRLVEKGGKIITKKELAGYIAQLTQHGSRMDITNVMVDGNKAWCKWRLGATIGAGLITFGPDGVSEEQLFYS